MMRWILVILCCGAVFGTAQAADSLTVRREVKGWAKGRWAVVDTREVKGMLVVVSDAVGREIDLTASYRFGLFQGETVYNQGWRLPVLTQPIAGFQSAIIRSFQGRGCMFFLFYL